ncbi:MAG: hypothetical protein F6K22_22090 [Okeania sp. SIO2F4]|uniref:hypothetical protein n=1 Tax=Okeania sp. SIO2F4 TaxID=2607790 RepID=UPI001429ADE4|nr:hypothetical protein [Okeania sp. SIO2F4]NES05271.1 hypothetical protein [Okeania sp. SIO2F4]
MSLSIQGVVSSIKEELAPQFEEKLRSYLVQQDRDWLIEQIIRLTLDSFYIKKKDIKAIQEQKALERLSRIERLKDMALDRQKLNDFIKKNQKINRDRLIEAEYLINNPPEKGTDLITEKYRSDLGNELLILAKDVLFALLFGDESNHVKFTRIEQELLTLTVPRFKSESLNFMKATTEISGLGTWQDPDSVSNDSRADNIILQVEYGEIEGELIGNGIVTCLSLINNLEINEQILYARMINVEESTLIT